ncbi:MAG: pyridoxal phosphate-dependent aminotransferase [Bacteroidia bacterium]|nr:pyridoxal phosphate-dependent aminotransferase [Bacteroidia bacterium]
MTKSSESVLRTIKAMSISYNDKIYELKGQNIDVIVLSLGEAFFDIPLFPFNDLPFPDIYHYSHSRGLLQLREKIAKYFHDQYHFDFNSKHEIIITAGSKVAIHMSFMAILNPGDEVIIYEPYWVSYTEQVKLCYGVPVTIPYYKNVFDTEQFITNKTKCIVISNPNNPMGKIYTSEELEYLHLLANKYDLYVLSDEAYSDFVPVNTHFHSMGKFDINKTNTIVCNSMSKNYGMSGWRIGYVISNSDLIEQILKINQHLITCPATILEHYLVKHFYEILEITKPQIQKVVEHRKQVADYMDHLGIVHLPGEAAWYFFASISPSKLGSEEFCEILLNEHHVGCVPGIGYGSSCDQFIRICVGTENMERTIEGLKRIKSLIQKTS